MRRSCDAVQSRPANRIPGKAICHIHITLVIDPRVAERQWVDIWLDEMGEGIERRRMQRDKSKPEDD